jgi:hypothetical protein
MRLLDRRGVEFSIAAKQHKHIGALIDEIPETDRQAVIDYPDTATAPPDAGLGDHAWLRLAEVRQTAHPARSLPVYWRLIDSALQTADRRAYAAAERLLKRALDAAAAGDEVDAFDARLAALRERHRRRPSLITVLDKAKLAPRQA